MGKKLTIKGHPTRGKEVIELFKMMGARHFVLDGTNDWYVINDLDNSITFCNHNYINCHEFVKFTLEEFLEKFPFKVGDKVMVSHRDSLTIKSMSWSEDCETMVYDFEESDAVLCAEDLLKWNNNKLFGTVGNPVETKSYTVSLKDDKVIDNPIDASQFMQIGKTVAVCFNTENYENEVELKLGDYEIVVRDGKTYAVLKKPKYPKLTNLSECKEILGEKDMYQGISGYKGELLTIFQRLLIFRDAYWQIAGEEMGLAKPWEPDWDNLSTNHEFIKIDKGCFTYSSRILVFPTEEMRDAFYENFKDLIEQCKELL